MQTLSPRRLDLVHGRLLAPICEHNLFNRWCCLAAVLLTLADAVNRLTLQLACSTTAPLLQAVFLNLFPNALHVQGPAAAAVHTPMESSEL